MNSLCVQLWLLLQVAAGMAFLFPGHQTNPTQGGYGIEWQGWGGSIYNNRWASRNRDINSRSSSRLATHCKIAHPNGVSATPTIFDGMAYYPTWSGMYIGLDIASCTIKWSVNVKAYLLDYKAPTPFQLAVTNTSYLAYPLSSRSSAQVDEKTRVLYFTSVLHALVFAVSIDDGTVYDMIQINPNEAAIATMSPTLYQGILYAGASSLEEGVGGNIPGYQCCSFVGNVVALKFDRTAKHWSTVWNVTTLPIDGPAGGPNGTYGSGKGVGWAGGGIWGSQPSIDPVRKRVFFATGNTYFTPPEYIHCTDERFDPSNATLGSDCFPPRIWQNAVLALDLLTGDVAWVRRFGPADVFVAACGGNALQPIKNPKSCPGNPGPDYDFGMAPSFVPGSKTQSGKSILTLGQKSGLLYGINAKDGEPLWSVLTSPGGNEGGLTWGIAVDTRRAYFAGVNSQNGNWTLQPRNKTVVTKGLFGAARLTDGKLAWEIAVPKDHTTLAPPTTVGDLVLFGRLADAEAPGGEDSGLVVVNKNSGEILLDYPVEGVFRGGIAVQDEYILFGTGYRGGTGYVYVLKI